MAVPFEVKKFVDEVTKLAEEKGVKCVVVETPNAEEIAVRFLKGEKKTKATG